MKNLISSLFLVFIFFNVQQASAVDCETAGKVKLSQLKYVGADLTSLLKKSDCTVLKNANTDGEARPQCQKLGKSALNPGNPQYNNGSNEHGSAKENNLEYYFCVSMNKHEMCDQRARELGSTMNVVWQKTGSGDRNDGDCLCGKKGDNGKKVICPTTEVEVNAFKTGNSTGCSVPGAEAGADGQCRCIAGSSKGTIVATGGSCPESQTQVNANVDDADLEECITELKEAKASCSDKGKAAFDKCSKEAPEVNNNISNAQQILSLGLDTIIAKNAGTGALAACAKMGAAGTTAIQALNLLRKSCQKELDSCRQGCQDVAALSEQPDDVYIEQCKQKFESAQPKKEWTDAHKDRLEAKLKELKDLGANAEKFCNGDVQKSDTDLGSFINELALSVQKANVCQCQLTASSNGTSCEEVSSPLTCIQNVNQPGCSFSTVGCTPGSTLPNCINPISAINPNGSGVNMPASGFAGPGFASGGGGTVNTGKVGIGDGDLSGLFDETRPSGSGTATADAGSPFGTAAAASSGGGGGGGGGDSGAAGGTGEGGDEKDKGGLSGLFQSARGGLANLFGGGADGKSTGAKKPDNKSYKNDVNGFRPKSNVRGMANSPELGGKNRDIWKTMNERYNDQYHTFITVETPPQK